MKKVVYYRDAKGNGPVQNFIFSLPEDEKNKCFEYINRLRELGESIRRPIGDYLGNKLYELRPKQTRIIYFFMLKDYAVLVHAFRKKTDAVPVHELRIAAKRMNDLIARVEHGQIRIEDNIL